jgi:hypothetical protein
MRSIKIRVHGIWYNSAAGYRVFSNGINKAFYFFQSCLLEGLLIIGYIDICIKRNIHEFLAILT